MKRILFVCHGNICRSPMAEYIMKHLVSQSRTTTQFHIESAATSTEEIGNPVYPPARRMLQQHGISCDHHAARQIRPADYHHFDYIICMDSNNMRNMHRIFGGDPQNKLHKLLDYTPQPRDVADPWYTGNFEATWNDCMQGCTALLHQLTH